MSLIGRRVIFSGIALVWTSQAALRVCADPDNLPFSNRQQQGFENEVVRLVARHMGEPVQYVWRKQERGYIRNSLNARECDLIPGVAVGVGALQSSIPYYRSSYVMVTRASAKLTLGSLDSPQLKRLRIGVQLVGDDYANTPPVHALAARGIVNVRGFRVVGDSSSLMIEALERREIDVGIAWGPVAGYYASRSRVPLRLEPISGRSSLPMAFDIGMGMRRRDDGLRKKIDRALLVLRGDLESLLMRYNIPLVTRSR
jgi:mxaJ protein